MIDLLKRKIHRLRNARSGTVAAIIAMAMTGIFGMTALVVDVGALQVAKHKLQASTDAAALAGANDINCCAQTKAAATARSYSAVAGGANATSEMTVTMSPGYPQFRCLRSIPVLCTGTDNANAIVVRQVAVVPMSFAKIIGISSVTISTKATAAVNIGTAKQLDVMIILDNTGSMSQDLDSNCGYTNPLATKTHRIDCALAGARTLLAQLDPLVDNVGLMMFPGTDAASVGTALNCSGTKPAIVKYSANPVYQIAAVGNYSNTVDTAKDSQGNNKSGISNALQDGTTTDKTTGATCKRTLSAPDSSGIDTFFADVIDAAQSALKDGPGARSGAQKVMILLSDGDANSKAVSTSPINKGKDECHQAISAANRASAAGTYVYAVAYGAPTAATASCKYDNPRISGCDTMQQIASNSSYFFSSDSGKAGTCNSVANPITKLVDIFSAITRNATSQVSGPSLVADDTP